MKSLSIICYTGIILLLSTVLMSCNEEGPQEYIDPEEGVAVKLQLSVESPTRAFADDNTHRVNRILAIPFRKMNEALSNDNANFVPAYTLAVQKDVSQFPTNSVIHLPLKTTYKLLVIGYNQNDYNYADQSNPANKFSIGSINLPTTLDNFHLYPQSPTVVPEFFVSICNVYNGGTLTGTTFLPEEGYTVSGNLNRLVSGFSLSISNIPTFVKSISLVAENLTKVSKATDASVILSQTTGDNGNRMIEKKIPSSSWSVVFNNYLLPTFDTHKTGFFLDVEYGSYTQRYTLKVNDTEVSLGNKFILNPNHAINISGDYSNISLGFNINTSINLDDNAWDGLQ